MTSLAIAPVDRAAERVDASELDDDHDGGTRGGDDDRGLVDEFVQGQGRATLAGWGTSSSSRGVVGGDRGVVVWCMCACVGGG